jgi:hypothetical protein
MQLSKKKIVISEQMLQGLGDAAPHSHTQLLAAQKSTAAQSVAFFEG